MPNEDQDRHIVLSLSRSSRAMIVISPVETFARVEPIGAPLRPHPTDRNTIVDGIRCGTVEIRAEIPEERVPTLSRSSLCLFSHHLAIAVGSRYGDDTVMLIGPGWWQIVRRRDGVPSSITTRTGDAIPALAAELVRSTTPLIVIAESPSLPVCAGTVIWYPYAAFACHRRLRRLNLARSTRRSVRRGRIGVALALFWLVIATALAVPRAPASLPRTEFTRHSDVPVVADVTNSTVAQELVMFARALSGRFTAERIEFEQNVFSATGVLAPSTAAEIDRAGLELRRIDVTGTATRAVVAMNRNSVAAVAHTGHHTPPPNRTRAARGTPLSTVIRSIAESQGLEITYLRHVHDTELVVTFVGTPDRILAVVFATDTVTRIVRIVIEPIGDSMQMMCVLAPDGLYER